MAAMVKQEPLEEADAVDLETRYLINYHYDYVCMSYDIQSHSHNDNHHHHHDNHMIYMYNNNVTMFKLMLLKKSLNK